MSPDLAVGQQRATNRIHGLLLEVEPGRPPIADACEGHGDPMAWLACHHDVLHEAVTRHGAVLVRGLDVCDADAVRAAAACLIGELMIEKEGFAPRDAYPGGVYSATRWAAADAMCSHNELSYAAACPRLMLFACARAPQQGGATTLADSREVLAGLSTGLVDEFAEHGWLLRRRYGRTLGTGLGEAFGTDSREAVERYCRAHGIGFTWEPDGSLRTWQRSPAVVNHPLTSERTWCNQIAFLNAWTLDPDVREYLLAMHGPDGLPFDTARGDGQPISREVIAALNEAYERAVVREPWQAGDLLFVDNVRMAHGREPYQGPRDVLVAMGQPVRLAAS